MKNLHNLLHREATAKNNSDKKKSSVTMTFCNEIKTLGLVFRAWIRLLKRNKFWLHCKNKDYKKPFRLSFIKQ